MTFLGFMCKWQGAEDYKTKQWVKVRAKIGVEYQKDYHGEGPVLYAETCGTGKRDKGRCAVLGKIACSFGTGLKGAKKQQPDAEFCIGGACRAAVLYYISFFILQNAEKSITI